MGLEVYRGKNQANRKYELEFFREFAATLTTQFKDQRRDGVLLGHPLSTYNPNRFKPDTIVVTSHCVVIVDFKNEQDGATITLPDENAFTSMPWTSRVDNIPHAVSAGKSVNPFRQLQRQVRAMEEVLRRAGSPGVPVHACVLFQGDVQVEGRVPGKYQAFFSIATKSTYPNVLEDSFNIDVDWGVEAIADFAEVVKRFEVYAFADYGDLVSASLALATSTEEASQNWQKADDAVDAAEAKEKYADKNLVEAKLQGQSLREAEKELELAKEEAQAATAEAKKLRKKFDDKRHQLQLSRSELEVARQQTEQRKVELEVARQLTKQKEVEALGLRSKTEALGLRSRTTQGWLALAALAAVALIAAASLVFYPQFQQQEAARLLADQEAGRVCIPAGEASGFVGLNDVCVTFTVRHVGESGNGFVFIQEQNRGSFTALVMNNSIISAQEAEDAYEGRQVEVRGDMTDYKGTTQIEIYDPSQVTVVN